MTRFLRDISRQPEELQGVIDSLYSGARPRLDEAAAVRPARHVYLTEIGSNWHAALNAESLFHRAGFPIHARDAAELLDFDALPEGFGNYRYLPCGSECRDRQCASQKLAKSMQPLLA